MSVILLVEASPNDRVLLCTILRSGGYAVQEATSAREAAEGALEAGAQAALIDLELPDADGLAVCRAFRADPRLAHLPLVLLLRSDDEAAILEGLRAGADDCVRLDVAPEILLTRLARLIRDRRLEDAFGRTEPLAQIGRLVTGIIHELRGPLAVIRGNAELMSLTLGLDHQCQIWLEPILRNAQLVQVRLDHLLAAVRSGPPVLQVQPVEPIVREAAELFQKAADPRRGQLSLGLELADGLPDVKADAGRLMLVLLNLLSNAGDAVFDGRREGAIRLATRLDHDGGEPWVVVEVRDDGPGIPEPLLERIFEPFFTTKADGTGYGLYLAREIIQEHSGRLTACNLQPEGACFALRLPPAQ